MKTILYKDHVLFVKDNAKLEHVHMSIRVTVWLDNTSRFDSHFMKIKFKKKNL